MAERRTLSRRTLIGAGIFGAVGIGAATAVGVGVANRGGGAGSAALQLSWLHSVQFGGSYIALDRGYWSEAGLDVSLLQGGPNAPVEPPVVSGQALVGVSAVDFAAAAAAVGAPLSVAATLAVVPVVLTTMLLPITVGGWGVREGAAVALLPLAGVSTSAALAASILFGLLALAASLPGIVPLWGRQGVRAHRT